METRSLAGRSIAPVGLGAMPLSMFDHPNEASAVRVIHAALDAGMNLIDTADIYAPGPDALGHNERLIARALRERSSPGDVLVATKGGLEHHADGSYPINGDPRHLERSCEASLRALGVDAIDIYQLHAPDLAVPFADSVGALARLRASGKIRHAALSNVNVRQIVEAEAIVPIASVQNCLGPLFLDDFHRGVLAHCEARGIAYLAYAPFGGRRLKHRIAEDPALCHVARRRGASPFAVVLAWILSRSGSIIAIPGARRVETVIANAMAWQLCLDDDDLRFLERAFPTGRGVPG